ncbi:hypothetical protein RRG08_032564 [Elysia crispata]|uniref:Uncharacterized protein n=1 Tax=Elysia crispata TaxID=231223 RepID=A0AAE0ZYW6_9GAST|nr:hypothetical protein RRG08_032564 [Elysia crispata]
MLREELNLKPNPHASQASALPTERLEDFSGDIVRPVVWYLSGVPIYLLLVEDIETQSTRQMNTSPTMLASMVFCLWPPCPACFLLVEPGAKDIMSGRESVADNQVTSGSQLTWPARDLVYRLAGKNVSILLTVPFCHERGGRVIPARGEPGTEPAGLSASTDEESTALDNVYAPMKILIVSAITVE